MEARVLLHLSTDIPAAAVASMLPSSPPCSGVSMMPNAATHMKGRLGVGRECTAQETTKPSDTQYGLVKLATCIVSVGVQVAKATVRYGVPLVLFDGVNLLFARLRAPKESRR